MESLNKLIKIVTNAINGKKEKINLTQNEAVETREILQEFRFIYCYPNDNRFFNKKVLDKAIKENKFINDKFYPNTLRYDSLMEDEQRKHGLEKNKEYIEEGKIEKEGININKTNIVFEKEDNGIIVEYSNFVPTYENILTDEIRQGNLVLAKLYVPLTISGELKEKMLQSKQLLSKENNAYCFSMNAPAFSYEWEHGNLFFIVRKSNVKRANIETLKQSILARYKVEYVEIDGVLIHKEYYDTKVYQKVKEAQDNQLKLYIVDEFNKVDNQQGESTEVIHDLRTAIAHCRTYDYKVNLGKYYYLGKMYLIIKETEEGTVKKAIFCISQILKHFTECNIYNNPDQSEVCFFYHPNIENKITTEEQAVEFQNKCRIVTVKLNQKVDFDHLEFIIMGLFNDCNLNDNCDDALRDYIFENLSKTFKIKNVNIEKVENQNVLEKKFAKNSAFYQFPFPNNDFDQQAFAMDITSSYYDAKSFTADWINKTKEEKRLQLKAHGVGSIISNIEKLLNYYVGKNKVYKYDYFQAYKSEVYYVLCMIVAYSTFVRNGYIENFEYENLHSTINSHENKIETEKMDNFRFYGLTKKFKGEGKVPSSKSDKIDTIRWIRNALCHSGVFVRHDGSNNYEDNFFYFVNENENLSKDEQRKPDNVVRVRCKDLMEFAMRPLFANYNKDEEKLIEGDSFAEVVNKGVEILKNYPL